MATQNSTQAPVVPVGEMAHRPLERGAAQDGRSHEGGDAGIAEAHAGAEHMAQAQQRTAEHARDQRAQGADGRDREQLDQAELGRLGDLRLIDRRERDRQQREREQHRYQHEGHEAVAVTDQDQPLPDRQRDHVDDQVDGEHLAPLVGRRHHVEPALDHQVQADQAQAGDEPQHPPEQGVDPQGVQQRQRGRHRRHGREGADESDLADDVRAGIGAVDRTGKIGRHHQSGHQAGEVGGRCLRADGGEHQAGTHDQQAHAAEQGGQRNQQFSQDLLSIVL
jgi:hypothetical protein